jgi:hypothetical protein
MYLLKNAARRTQTLSTNVLNAVSPCDERCTQQGYAMMTEVPTRLARRFW